METLPERYLRLIKWTELNYKNFVEKVDIDKYETALNEYPLFPSETYPENYLLLWYKADVSRLNDIELKKYQYEFKEYFNYLYFACMCFMQDVEKETANNIPEIMIIIERMYNELTNWNECIKQVFDEMKDALPVLQNDKKHEKIITRYLLKFDKAEELLFERGYINIQRKWIKEKQMAALLVNEIYLRKWFKKSAATEQAQRNNVRKFFEDRFQINISQQFKPTNINTIDKTFKNMIDAISDD